MCLAGKVPPGHVPIYFCVREFMKIYVLLTVIIFASGCSDCVREANYSPIKTKNHELIVLHTVPQFEVVLMKTENSIECDVYEYDKLVQSITVNKNTKEIKTSYIKNEIVTICYVGEILKMESSQFVIQDNTFKL